MAKELTPTGETIGYAARSYPWNEWLNGRPWRINMGEDFDMEPSSFRTYLYRTAKRRGLRLVSSLGYDDSITFQTYAPDAPRPLLPGDRGRNGKGYPAEAPTAPREMPTCSQGPHPIQGGGWALGLGYCASVRTGTVATCQTDPTPNPA